MPKQPKRHIAVSAQERAQLEEAKQQYEAREGQTDWGDFLKVAAGLGLAALGVYALTRPTRRNTATWDVRCPNRSCGVTFPVVAEVPPTLVQVPCPNCGTELIVDFRDPGSRPSMGNSDMLTANSERNLALYCAHCSRQMQVNITDGAGVEDVTYLQCPFCGGVAMYGVGMHEP